MKHALTTLMVILISVSSLAGDILTLNNQMVFEGKLSKIKDCAVVFKTEGKRYIVPASEIFSIQFENPENRVYTKYVEMAKGDTNACLNGRFDAENFHGKREAHFVLGVLFGPFAMIGTALSNPTPNRGRHTYLLSKNKDQFSDLEYLKCYRRKALTQLIGAEAAGWGAWLVFLVIVSL